MKWNLENLNFDKENQRTKINSPRSKEALNRLGYSDEDFHFLSFKNFLNKYPNIRALHKDLHKTSYDHYEKKRIEKLNEARKLRRKIIDILSEEENQNQAENENDNNNNNNNNNNYNEYETDNKGKNKKLNKLHK